MKQLVDAIMGRRVTLGRVVTLRLSARSEIKVVEQIVRETVRFLEGQAHPPEDWILRFSLCLRETVYNAVVHGNVGVPNAMVDVAVDYHPDAGRVVIAVRDGGHGFDWRTALAAQQSLGAARPRGRGLVILAEMTDAVEVAAGEVRFTLTVPPAALPAAGA